MEIKDCKYRLRCEMGACGNRAEYTICPARVGIRSSIHICASCLDQLVAESKKLAGVKETADADVTGGQSADKNLAAGGDKKFPLKRKSKKAVQAGETSASREISAGEESKPVISGQIVFDVAERSLTEDKFDEEGKQTHRSNPTENKSLQTRTGLLRYARNDGRIAEEQGVEVEQGGEREQAGEVHDGGSKTSGAEALCREESE